MIFRKILTIYIIFISHAAFSCAAEDLPGFQVNEKIDYKIFDILDPYPALYDIVDHLSQYKVNQYLSEAVNARTLDYIDSTEDRNIAITHPQRPLHESLQLVRRVLERIIN